MSLKSNIKKFIPEPILTPLQRLHSKIINSQKLREENRLIIAQPDLHRKAMERVRQKNGPINVVFFAIMDSVWKYDELYNLMVADKRFNPTILVCPVVNYGRDNMLMNMDKCYDLFLRKGYNVIRSYDKANDRYVDVRKELDPDIIFYTNPYEGLIDDRYFIKNFTDTLTCYVTYSVTQSKRFDLKFGSLFSNLLWRYYIEYSYLKDIAPSYSRSEGINIVHTGFPGIDKFIKDDKAYKDEWPIKDKNIKRIIWAPHHTITDYTFVGYSTFLTYCNFMLDMADKYKEQIQIAFKPHPLLKNRLEIMWGEEKTKEYYDNWAKLPNGILNDGAYEDLFMSSDAIIHDSGSFIIEYLYTRKPAMYLSNGKPFEEQYNTFARKCLDHYYIGKSKDDIEAFILNVITGKDTLEKERESFYYDQLLPPNGKLASENIIKDLVISLDLEHVQ